MRKLTTKLLICLEASIVDGDEHNFADSGELLQKGTKKFVVLRPLLHAILLPDDLLDKALLLVYPSELGVVRIDDMLERAPARALVTAADRERMRGIGRARKRKNITAVLHMVL
jgi:hypothetical protein